ncbi:MAG: TAXI family TRAP transporter solute-binding subunit [Firmicutes bacterium]|nr:TAXI family TRAP transporter solute-binding subunit [Bacillota bacterium]MCL5040612.1 TAXI family TRAP transporter solute-binding subunit [Bacillota bacterium]
MQRVKMLLAVVLVLTIVLAGCGGASKPATPGGQASTTPPPAKAKLSIATGGTGGVYYVYGGGLANLITKNLSNAEATAEVTSASVDNAKLLQSGKADLAFMMGDVAYDAANGKGKFEATGKAPLRSLAVLYSNFTHIVVMDGSGIKKVADLKGKKVSTGSPGSGTEVIANRVLEAAGLNPDKDIVRERLGVTESAGALKDRKVDAFFWSGGLPTAAILDLAATPGIKIRLLPHEEELKKMADKYGPIYFKLVIPKGTYKGFDEDVPVSGVANLLVVNEKMNPDLVYSIVKLMFDKKSDLVVVHKEAENLKLETATTGSSLEFHPGAVKFYQEKGVWKK